MTKTTKKKATKKKATKKKATKKKAGANTFVLTVTLDGDNSVGRIEGPNVDHEFRGSVRAVTVNATKDMKAILRAGATA